MDDRTRLTAYRTIVEALLMAHMSHKKRNSLMIILWNMIRVAAEQAREGEYQNCLHALMEVLRFVTVNATEGNITHAGAKEALRLFYTTATATIVKLYDPAYRRSDDYIPF